MNNNENSQNDEKSCENSYEFLSEEETIKLAKNNLLASINIYKAMKLATEIHKEQYYGKEEPFIFPYIYHLDSVSKVILNSLPAFYPHKAELLIGAWLHDSIEDQSDKITFEKIESQFGPFVKDLIYNVTDPKDKDGNDLPRKERAKLLVKRLENNHYSLILKLADKIANVEFCIMMLSIGGYSLFDMYKEEFKLFKEVLYNPEHDECVKNLWEYLEHLINNPKEYF